MPDKLTEAYETWLKDHVSPSSFELFQAGYTSGAVSMRARAVKAAQDNKDQNTAINAIGSLSDIPE